RLKADDQDGRLLPPDPVLEAMANATGFAHSAGGDYDMELAEPIESFALLDSLREAHIPRFEAANERFASFQFACVIGEDLTGLGRKRGVDVDRYLRKLAFTDQLDEIADQLLGSLDRK